MESFSLRVSASFTLWNNATSSASAPEDNTFFMMAERPWIVPFDGDGGLLRLGLVDLLDRKKCYPALDRAFMQERYEALLCI